MLSGGALGMKTFFYTFLLILISTSYAPTVFAQSQAFVAYAIPANDPYENSLSGAGWHFNYDAITLHTELTFDRAGLTAFGKRAIISDNLYIKYGSALARQKFFLMAKVSGRINIPQASLSTTHTQAPFT